MKKKPQNSLAQDKENETDKNVKESGEEVVVEADKKEECVEKKKKGRVCRGPFLALLLANTRELEEQCDAEKRKLNKGEGISSVLNLLTSNLSIDCFFI